MASEIRKERVYGNFKPSPANRLKSKRLRARKKATERPGNDAEYLKKIRQLPCIVSGETSQIEAHHLKCTGERGAGMKSPDKWALPLTHENHHQGVEKAGSRNEEKWFRDRGIDCLSMATALWGNRHSLEAMQAVWQAHWDNKPKVIELYGPARRRER